MIKAPPRQVPDHLQPRHYCRLAIQYYLMGWTRQAVKSGRRALAGVPHELEGTPFSELSEEDFGRFRRLVEGLDHGVSVGEQLFGISRSFANAVQDGMDATSALTDELIKDNKTLRLIKFGLEESLRQLSLAAQQAVTKTAEEAVKLSQPPREVPEDLTPQEYLELARRYLSINWTEQCRDSLLKAREIEGTKLKGELAWTMLKTKLPREPVPYLAEEGLADARRKLLIGKDDEAAEALEELIARYPQLEPPYCMLSAIRVREGKLEKAESLLSKAAELNPNYLNTWLELARVHAIGGSILEAQRALDRASDLDADDPEIPPLRQLISILSRL